jgi:hypothetical protein
MEAMAVEALVASSWTLDGFLAKTRVPVFLGQGYTDIDVVGVRADREVRLAECKVPWGASFVSVVKDETARKFASDWLGTWATHIENIGKLWDDRPLWLPKKTEVSRLTFCFYGNIWFPSDEEHAAAERSLTALVRSRCPRGLNRQAVATVSSTRDLLFGVLRGVRREILDHGYGKRFGDPVLDALRELVRYAHPAPHGGGQVAGEIRAETREQLLDALGLLPEMTAENSPRRKPRSDLP